MKSFADRLANFLEWCEVRAIDPLVAEYKRDLIGRYQAEMSKGIWARDATGLAVRTINSRVEIACELLSWAADKGLRAPSDIAASVRIFKRFTQIALFPTERLEFPKPIYLERITRMGREKERMMEAYDRGWWSSDRYVCAECVRERFLSALIAENAESDTCDFCESSSTESIAAPFDIVIEAVASAVFFHFSDPLSANAPRDEGEYAITTRSTEDVLLSFDLDCNDDVFEALAGAFENDRWVESAGGHWGWSHPNEILSYSWRDFERTVKHKTRYFFQNALETSTIYSDEIPPGQILDEIRQLILSIGLIEELPIGQKLYRCRLRSAQDTWELSKEQLGAPPADRTRAGRMNPAGIAYLYTAFEPKTAIAETVGHPPVGIVMAEFANTQPLTVVNLCNIPEWPSVFDAEKRSLREHLLFLHEFTAAISRPVNKDGGEHIEYVPSQVVSEYFSQILELKHGRVGVDGVIYPSAVLPKGKNLVLFPVAHRFGREFDHMDLSGKYEIQLTDWKVLTDELYPRDDSK